ncbi:MAG: hypothetical protein H8K03_19860 [Nitrospira sp.]
MTYADIFCVAHELFDMTAVDINHRERVYPPPDRELIQLEKDLIQGLPKDVAEAYRQDQLRRTEFESEVILRVRAVREQRK